MREYHNQKFFSFLYFMGHTNMLPRLLYMLHFIREYVRVRSRLRKSRSRSGEIEGKTSGRWDVKISLESHLPQKKAHLRCREIWCWVELEGVEFDLYKEIKK